MFVKDFDSGNGNRDSNMSELRSSIFLKLNTILIKFCWSKEKISFSGNLNFHGISKDLNINSEIKKTENKIILSGEFRVSLVTTMFNYQPL